MIDEYGSRYFLLSCDICGFTEAGPFHDFDEAVQYKKNHPDEWHSLRLTPPGEKATRWADVCGGCFSQTALGKWKPAPSPNRE